VPAEVVDESSCFAQAVALSTQTTARTANSERFMDEPPRTSSGLPARLLATRHSIIVRRAFAERDAEPDVDRRIGMKERRLESPRNAALSLR
jgi:hypothetical protein